MGVHKIKRIGLFIVLAAMLVTTVLLICGIGEDDFLVYWSAARLLAIGDNPYDPASLQTLQRETRPDRARGPGQAFASWNPPWLLVVLLPFGLLPFDFAVRAWTVCNIGLIAAASLLTWQLLDKTTDRHGVLIALASGLWFGQSLSNIHIGQISSLLLSGLVISAWCLHTGHDKLAGAALFLATIKPHVTYFVLLLLVLWAIRHRRWQVFVGMMAAGLTSIVILWLIFPGWISAYFHLASSHSFFQYSTSTIGGLAYALWGTDLLRFAGVVLLPFIPSMLRLADAWGWLTAMNVALLMSVPLAMYGFTFDQVVLLPAILQLIAWLWHRELPSGWAWAIAGGLLIVYVVLFAMLTRPGLYYHYFAWPPLALAGLYALAWKQRRARLYR